jgi:glycosyltransferase involved in cell wall biosynthesis
MEESLGQAIHWIAPDRAITWQEIGLDVPDTFVQSGWASPAFKSLGIEVKRAGGKNILLSDANWRGDMRQLCGGPIFFRLFLRRYFDGAMTPGMEGERLLRYFGLPKNRIRQGMYGADSEIFSSIIPILDREKTFLYVGQFIDRKNIQTLAKAFLRFNEQRTDWKLRLIGSGPLFNAIPLHPNIVVEQFLQPSELAQRYRQSMFFILPSTFEAWGLVVHEAALSGCALLLSKAVGSARDLATPENSFTFRATDENDIVNKMILASCQSDQWLKNAEIASRTLAAKFGPPRFAQEICALITEIESQSTYRS